MKAFGGDVISEIGNKEVTSPDMFVKEYKKAKEKVLLYVYHDGSNYFIVLKK
jgi:hypothetical protein